MYDSVEYTVDGGGRDHRDPELCTDYAMFFYHFRVDSFLEKARCRAKETGG